MFETIGMLFTVGIWIVAILMVVVGIWLCIDKLIKGDGVDKFLSAIALIAGIITFACVSKWLSNIVWSFLATGTVLSLVVQTKETTPPRPKEPGLVEQFADVYLESYAEQKIIEEAVEKGIRNARK